MSLKEKDGNVITATTTEGNVREDVHVATNAIRYPKARQVANGNVLSDEYLKNADDAYAAQLQSMSSMATFEKFDVVVKKLRDPNNHVCVLAVVTIVPTEETVTLRFKDLVSQKGSVREKLNKYQNLANEDLNHLVSKAQILYLLSDLETVEQLPFPDEWAVEESYQSLYDELVEGLNDDICLIAKDKSTYVKDSAKFIAVYESNFRDCGKSCLLFTKEKLAEELGLGGDERFDSVMRFWKAHDLLFVSKNTSSAQRCQVIYRVEGESRMHYAVVIGKSLEGRIRDFHK